MTEKQFYQLTEGFSGNAASHEHKHRSCLWCGKMFLSTWVGDRKCNSCVEQEKESEKSAQIHERAKARANGVKDIRKKRSGFRYWNNKDAMTRKHYNEYEAQPINWTPNMR